MKRVITDYTESPLWNGQVFIPFIQQLVNVKVENGNVLFNYHGLDYLIPLNQEVSVYKDSSVLVKIVRRTKYRTLRKPVGLPTTLTMFFVSCTGKALHLGDVYRQSAWENVNNPVNSMAQAFKQAIA